jgi:hypothetical protein
MVSLRYQPGKVGNLGLRAPITFTPPFHAPPVILHNQLPFSASVFVASRSKRHQHHTVFILVINARYCLTNATINAIKELVYYNTHKPILLL